MRFSAKLTKLFSLILLLLFPVVSFAAQDSAFTSLAKQLASYAPGTHLTIYQLQGQPIRANLIAVSQDELSIFDVDQNQEKHLQLSDVRKVSKGYGGSNQATGSHSHRMIKTIIIVALVGILMPIALACAARD